MNNVLIDFDKLLQNQAELLTKEFPTINEKTKILVNEFILRDTNIETLRVLCFSIVFIFILKNIFLYLKNLSMSFVQLRIVTQLRNRIYAHLQSLSLSFFHKRKSGDLSSVIIHHYYVRVYVCVYVYVCVCLCAVSYTHLRAHET